MKIHKLLLDCPKFNIREEISANLLYEALNGLPENPDERLRQTLDSWCNGTCGEIPDDDLHYVEENLAQTHHGSEHKLMLKKIWHKHIMVQNTNWGLWGVLLLKITKALSAEKSPKKLKTFKAVLYLQWL